MSGFCQSGLWPSVQSLVVFLVTNVLANAASMHLPAAADTPTITLFVFGAIIARVMLGANAFRVMDLWGGRPSFRLFASVPNRGPFWTMRKSGPRWGNHHPSETDHGRSSGGRQNKGN